VYHLIDSDPAVLGGKPCIKGTRLSVEFLLELAAGGAGVDQIITAYPQLSREAVREAFLYAAERVASPDAIGARAAG
jgi:uncharacterized protein (DUF433 family)